MQQVLLHLCLCASAFTLADAVLLSPLLSVVSLALLMCLAEDARGSTTDSWRSASGAAPRPPCASQSGTLGNFATRELSIPVTTPCSQASSKVSGSTQVVYLGMLAVGPASRALEIAAADPLSRPRDLSQGDLIHGRQNWCC
eukprot:TRINITY_DN299_c0_g1_i1.p1 TRINITY_DN299_c0_g1~~TRINITY_DN299_c0_g1_i1.p1  ORF type:complete len:142 (+),score=5.54 TRINITY_DN299_c0_g1_i1:1031-1456(+)